MHQVKGVSVRNKARTDLLGAFESVSVWLFPVPVEDSSTMSEKIGFHQLVPGFKTKLRQFRSALAGQLAEPMLFGADYSSIPAGGGSDKKSSSSSSSSRRRRSRTDDQMLVLTGERLSYVIPAVVTVLNSGQVVLPRPILLTMLQAKINVLTGEIAYAEIV
jgi:hypothetical protein